MRLPNFFILLYYEDLLRNRSWKITCYRRYRIHPFRPLKYLFKKIQNLMYGLCTWIVAACLDEPLIELAVAKAA
jgi:hypothetical protein